ncbi:DUF4827 family protein [Parabacteroides sp. PF5-6]|uniref:DUF4827 family protein n=1 Tax=Parabacteroides sp. PF5-6 TaxID=1742403 RepID=UPI0024059395|nr:DUF4827 family protein [Parabacteroides sp. PF5-6]MDF9830714.1 hypothetical protein [Parabacteroides sp. PF5-6]
MKRGFNVLLILFVGMVILSCNKTKSYTDMLKAEGKAIDRLIDQEGLEILKRMPSDYKFKENEYVKLDNDVYLQIVDTGDGTRATQYSSHILCRFTANRFMLDTATYQNRYSNFGPNSNGTAPIEFIYGYTTVIPQSSTTDYQSVLEGFMSEGLQAGLEYVGNKGRVRLIVPFKRGSSYDQQYGYAVHFEDLEYKILE